MAKEQYLDEAGLRLYNDLIRAYINKKCSVSGLDSLVALGEQVQANKEAIEILNGDGPNSVQGQIAQANKDFTDELERLNKQDFEVYDAIASIEEANINSLFNLSVGE